MQTTKIGWFGDSHLDYAQYGLVRRRDDFLYAVESALQEMLAMGIKRVIHTGDFLQSNRPSPYTMKCLQRMQQHLMKNGMTVYVVSGNHDNARPHWIDVVNAGDAQGFQLIDRKHVDVGGATIYGLPNMSREEFLKEKFKPADILVMHQAIRQFIDFPMPNALDITELPADKYAVIAVGDIHVYKIKRKDHWVAYDTSKCLIGYAGATELNSESEPDDKFWVELELSNDDKSGQRMWKCFPHKIRTRPIIRISLDEAELLDKAIDTVKKAISELKEQDSREPIIFIRYNSRIRGVIERFRKNFDPDLYILRFHAIFGGAEETEAVINPKAELSIADLLKAEIPEISGLYALASQLFNPELEADQLNVAVDQFIEERLKTDDQSKHTQTAEHRATRVS